MIARLDRVPYAQIEGERCGTAASEDSDHA